MDEQIKELTKILNNHQTKCKQYYSYYTESHNNFMFMYSVCSKLYDIYQD